MEDLDFDYLDDIREDNKQKNVISVDFIKSVLIDYIILGEYESSLVLLDLLINRE